MSQTNPPTPIGYKLMAQSQVTPDMTTLSMSILHDTNTYPMFAVVMKQFGSQSVLARVEWHPPDFNNGAIHRGVTLYVPATATQPSPTMPPSILARGIDVSGYQPNVDWAKVKADGNAFAFIKATEATTLVDHHFAAHWAAAKTAGLLRGAYHFFRPQLDAIAQAKHFLAQLGDRGELPPCLDVEVADGVSLAQIAAGVATWVDYVASNYGRSIIYTSPGFWNLLPANLIASKADLWVAHWDTSSPAKVHGWPSWSFWQYTSRATVSGIPGSADVDGDRFNGTVEGLQAYASRGDTFVENVTDNPGDETAPT